MFGFISLQTATELISLTLIFNKIIGAYGLLAILTGFQLSLLQFSTYLYSIAVLVALIVLVPHIRKQSPFECLALAWLNIIDTGINAFDTAIFGLEWYFSSATSPLATAPGIEYVPNTGAESVRQQAMTLNGGAIMAQDTAASMMLVVLLVLARVYFSVIVMAYAQQVLGKYMQLMVLEGAPGVELERDGPFGAELPDGDGRRGQAARLMVSFGRGYWLDQSGSVEEWQRDLASKQTGSSTV